MRTLTGIGCVALALSLTPAAPPVRAQEPGGADPLAGLEIEDGRPGWDGIRLGMSLVQAERRLGTTLAVAARSSQDAAGAPVCSAFAAEAERDGLRLVLGFPTARPGAKLESLWVRFEGEQVRASAEQLAAALRRRSPQAAYRGPAGGAEADDPRPTYLLPLAPETKTADAVRFVPREGMLLAVADCLR
jgi:hypothetical protein